MSKKKKNLADELINLKIREDDKEIESNNDDAFDQHINLHTIDEPTLVSGELEPTKDRTLQLIHTNTKKVPVPEDLESQSEVEEVRYGLPSRLQTPKDLAGETGDFESPLKKSEHLRIAQNKINNLEDEIVQLRKENEELASAAETYKKINDDYYAEIENLKTKIHDSRQTFDQETEHLKHINQGKDKQVNELKRQVDNYKAKIDNNFQRVRKREKDLEHRLEMAKMEEAAVIKSKDQLILDLKRKIDDIGRESDNFRKKSQENYQELQQKQQVVRGVIRALRLALTKLEGEDASDFGLNTDEGDFSDEN